MRFSRMGRRGSIGLILIVLFLHGSAVMADESKPIPDLINFEGTAWNRISRINAQYTSTFKFDYDTNYGDLVKALDRFYTDERNLRTPVAYAIMLIKKDADSLKGNVRSALVSKENTKAN